MCGIAGIHRRSDAAFPKMGKLADALLLEIEGRGPDSTGYLAVKDNGLVQIDKRVLRARFFTKVRTRFSEDARSLLLHTRFATVGTVNERNAHPVISGRCAAVHNGTIYNATELFQTFGLKRHAQVDSEIIPALIDYAGWEQATDALELMTGGAAAAVVNVDHPRDLLLARTSGYPLVAWMTDDFIVWASTERALRRAWKETYGHDVRSVGTWIDLAPYTAMRVRGESVAKDELTPPAPDPWSWTRPARAATRTRVTRSSTSGTVKAKGKSGKAATKPTARQRRKAAKKARGSRSTGTGGVTPTQDMGQLSLPAPAFEREPWMEEIVHDLMRVEGYERSDAEELVYGHEFDHDEWSRWLMEDDR